MTIINNYRDLRKYINNKIKEITKEKFTTEKITVKSGNGLKYFGYKVYFENSIINDNISLSNSIYFSMSYARKDYFKEDFILRTSQIDNQLNDLINDIKEVLKNESEL